MNRPQTFRNRGWHFSLVALLAVMPLVGCSGGNGGSTTTVTGASLRVAPVVPPGRSAKRAGQTNGSRAADVPLLNATVEAFDITNGLPATSTTPDATGNTGTSGSCTLTGLKTSVSYMIRVRTSTINMGTIVQTASTTPATAPSVPVDIVSTVAVKKIAETFSTAGAKISALIAQIASFNTLIANLTTQRTSNETLFASIDLSGELNTTTGLPTAIVTIIVTVITEIPELKTIVIDDPGSVNDGKAVTGTYLAKISDSSSSSSNALVSFLYNATGGEANLVFIYRDNTGAIIDADYLVTTVSSTGTFTATTKDNLYTVTGSVVGKKAEGTWASTTSNSLTGSGSWKAEIADAPTQYQGVGYYGSYTRTGAASDTNNRWFIFVLPNGNALMFARDESRPERNHFVKTAVFFGTVSSSGVLSAGMAFPIEAGTITGNTPVGGGTATGTGSGSYGGNTVTVTNSSVTGTISGNSVTGTWSATGAKNGSDFNTTGTFTGTKR